MSDKDEYPKYIILTDEFAKELTNMVDGMNSESVFNSANQIAKEKWEGDKE